MALSFFFLGISLFGMCCAYCNKYIPYCIVLTDLFASRLWVEGSRAHTCFPVATALIGVLLYIVSMQDVEARRFTSYNSVYLVGVNLLTRPLTRLRFQLSFGYAAYCAIAGAILCVINFVLAIPMVVLTYAWNRAKHNDQSGGMARGRKQSDNRLGVSGVWCICGGVATLAQLREYIGENGYVVYTLSSVSVFVAPARRSPFTCCFRKHGGG
jgi:hypothetical protein